MTMAQTSHKVLAYLRRWKREHPDKVRQQRARWRARHPQYVRDWRRRNHDNVNAYRRTP
ncbi:MAG: hypothetical protein ND866_01560 [Pyrinomonadaceae bacterium]|nr:hypothetical protein [Pyrinomonadaceae bacterium]